MTKRARPGWIRRGARIALPVALVAWAGLLAYMLLSAKSASERGIDALEGARASRTFDGVVDPATEDLLREARLEFADAHAKLSNPLVAPARLFPVLGRQIRAADRLDEQAAAATGLAADTVAEVRRLTARAAPEGPERAELVRELAALAARAGRQLEAMDPGDDEALVDSLQQARTEFVDARTEAVEALDVASTLLDGTAAFLDGGTYLLLGANNAEMRAGSGMFLSATELTTSQGGISLGPVGATRDLVLPQGVEPPAELASNWDWLDTGRDFRNLGLTPQFPVSAELAARMWAETPGGGPVDGVISLDVDGVRSLLKVVGPVEVDGVTYDERTVRRLLLNAQYRGADQEERLDSLSAVAREVFARIEAGGWDVGDLATELVAAAGGRHLMVWSADEVQQQAWEAASADGHLDDDSLAVSVLNRGANKLDWFLDAATVVATEPAAGGGTDVTVTVSLRNTTPDGQPKYVAGPNIDGLAEGEYTGVVVVNAPGAAEGLEITGGEYQTLDGPDGPTRAVGVYLRLPRGEAAQVVVTFTLPSGTDSMRIEPSARVQAMRWTLGGREYPIERRRTHSW